MSATTITIPEKIKEFLQSPDFSVLEPLKWGESISNFLQQETLSASSKNDEKHTKKARAELLKQIELDLINNLTNGTIEDFWLLYQDSLLPEEVQGSETQQKNRHHNQQPKKGYFTSLTWTEIEKIAWKNYDQKKQFQQQQQQPQKQQEQQNDASPIQIVSGNENNNINNTTNHGQSAEKYALQHQELHDLKKKNKQLEREQRRNARKLNKLANKNNNNNNNNQQQQQQDHNEGKSDDDDDNDDENEEDHDDQNKIQSDETAASMIIPPEKVPPRDKDPRELEVMRNDALRPFRVQYERALRRLKATLFKEIYAAFPNHLIELCNFCGYQTANFNPPYRQIEGEPNNRMGTIVNWLYLPEYALDQDEDLLIDVWPCLREIRYLAQDSVRKLALHDYELNTYRFEQEQQQKSGHNKNGNDDDDDDNQNPTTTSPPKDLVSFIKTVLPILKKEAYCLEVFAHQHRDSFVGSMIHLTDKPWDYTHPTIVRSLGPGLQVLYQTEKFIMKRDDEMIKRLRKVDQEESTASTSPSASSAKDNDNNKDDDDVSNNKKNSPSAISAAAKLISLIQHSKGADSKFGSTLIKILRKTDPSRNKKRQQQQKKLNKKPNVEPMGGVEEEEQDEKQCEDIRKNNERGEDDDDQTTATTDDVRSNASTNLNMSDLLHSPREFEDDDDDHDERAGANKIIEDDLKSAAGGDNDATSTGPSPLPPPPPPVQIIAILPSQSSATSISKGEAIEIATLLTRCSPPKDLSPFIAGCKEYEVYPPVSGSKEETDETSDANSSEHAAAPAAARSKVPCFDITCSGLHLPLVVYKDASLGFHFRSSTLTEDWCVIQ